MLYTYFTNTFLATAYLTGLDVRCSVATLITL